MVYDDRIRSMVIVVLKDAINEEGIHWRDVYKGDEFRFKDSVIQEITLIKTKLGIKPDYLKDRVDYLTTSIVDEISKIFRTAIVMRLMVLDKYDSVERTINTILSVGRNRVRQSDRPNYQDSVTYKYDYMNEAIKDLVIESDIEKQAEIMIDIVFSMLELSSVTFSDLYKTVITTYLPGMFRYEVRNTTVTYKNYNLLNRDICSKLYDDNDGYKRDSEELTELLKLKYKKSD